VEVEMMRSILAMVVLWPGVLLAADPVSTTGQWKIDGDVNGTPVKMVCALTETDHQLSGSCAGAADGFTPHKLAGKVKGQSVEFHFESAMQGNAISVIVSGKLSEDGSKLNGDLDVEPMQVGGAFAGVRVVDGDGGTAVAVTATPAAGSSVAENWKVDGDVQGTPVTMTCAIAEAEKKLSGTCTGAGQATAPRKLTGEVTEKGLSWHFDSEYEGNPITVSMSATKSVDGTKMNGTIAVAPMGVDGTFVAVKQ
jgi:hypothetical protein